MTDKIIQRDEDDLLGGLIASGPGYSCDTCGWSPDEISVEEYEPGKWSVERRSGCIGGSAAYGLTAAEAARHVRASNTFGEKYDQHREALAAELEALAAEGA
jgi:hypothetical protein